MKELKTEENDEENDEEEEEIQVGMLMGGEGEDWDASGFRGGIGGVGKVEITSVKQLWQSSNRRIKGLLVLIGMIVLALFLSTIVVAVTKPSESNGSSKPTDSVASAEKPWQCTAQFALERELGQFDNDHYYEDISGRKRFDAEDMVRAVRIGDPVVRRSGNKVRVIFTRRTWSVTRNESATQLWLQTLSLPKNDSIILDDDDIPASVPLTTFGWGYQDSQPCFAPDGESVMFLSNRVDCHHWEELAANGTYTPMGEQQLWQIRISDGRLRQLSHFPLSVEHLLLSPSAHHAAISVHVFPGSSFQQTFDTLSSRQLEQVGGYVYDKLMVRHWDEYFTGLRNGLFLLKLSYDETSHIFTMQEDDELIDVLKGRDCDVPTKPFGGRDEWSFDPRGTRLAFVLHENDHKSEMAWTTDLNVYVQSVVSPESAAVCITCDNEAQDSAPRFSPDGRYLAYLSMSVPGYESDRQVVMLHQLSTAARRSLTPAWTLSPSDITWTTSTDYLVASTVSAGHQSLYKVSTTLGQQNNGPALYSPFLREHHHSQVVVLNNDDLIFFRDSMVTPKDLFWFRHAANQLLPLTHVNDLMLSKVQMSKPTEFWFEGANDDPIHGFELQPVAPALCAKNSPDDNECQVALVYLIHGGPQGSWQDSWSYRWNPVVFSAQGYRVAMINFHGSKGYGQEFVDSIRGDYGGAPFEDMLKGVEALNADGPVLAAGASYGGFAINWINGHTDGMFRALICHDGIFSQPMLYFATEELWFPEHDQFGLPWLSNTDSPCSPDSCYARWDPAESAGQWSTPALIIHGGRDYRIPITHALAAFTTLQRRKIPSKLLFFPDENHWVLRPTNSLLWHQEVFLWLQQWSTFTFKS